MKYTGNFGLERETLRIDKNGCLAKTPHPFGLDEHITRDFCENQIELVTPVCKNIDDVIEALGELDTRTNEVLKKNNEKLWLYSNPPHFESEDDIPIAVFEGMLSAKSDYRMALQMRYGKRLMLLSGIHFNFSFSDDFLAELSGGKNADRLFKDTLYLRLYKQLMTHSFLLVLLTSASAYYDKSFDSDGTDGVVIGEYSSIRNSERGYFNLFTPVLDHSSVSDFCSSLDEYIRKGMLFSVSELYLPIRLKPKGENSLSALRESGVDHIELRMFDLNPKAPLGIDENDLKFAYLLIMYLLTLPDFEFTEELQREAVKKHKAAALLNTNPELLKIAENIINSMKKYFSDDEDALNIINYELSKLYQSQEERFVNYYRR